MLDETATFGIHYSQTKYLGFMFNTNAQDDEDMLRQMRIYIVYSIK